MAVGHSVTGLLSRSLYSREEDGHKTQYLPPTGLQRGKQDSHAERGRAGACLFEPSRVESGDRKDRQWPENKLGVFQGAEGRPAAGEGKVKALTG